MVQMVPSQLPQSVRDQADEYRKALAAAEQDAPAGADRCDAFERQLRDDGRKLTRASRASARRLKKAARRPPRSRPARARRRGRSLIALYRRIGEVIHSGRRRSTSA